MLFLLFFNFNFRLHNIMQEILKFSKNYSDSFFLLIKFILQASIGLGTFLFNQTLYKKIISFYCL